MSLIKTIKNETSKDRRWNVKRNNKDKIIEVIMLYNPNKKDSTLLKDKELLELLIKEKEKKAELQSKINVEIEKEKELQEKGLLVDPKCRFASTKGARCKKSVANAGDLCTIHEEVKQRVDGKETVCKAIKSDGKKCKMKTKATSGFCYYHD